MHPLRTLLDRAAAGVFPAVDGGFDVHPPMRSGRLAIVEFTGHAVILAGDSDTSPELIDRLASMGADGYGGASHPSIKLLLAGANGSIGTHDGVFVAFGNGPVGGDEPSVGRERLVERFDLDDEPRVRRARHHRHGVRVFADDVGLVTLGYGLVNRLEISVELFDETAHGAGSGRELIRRALDLVPAGDAIWAQVAPGNAASLRAFLACGFAPIGAETLIDTELQSD